MDRGTFYQVRQGKLWQLVAVGFCIVFGLSHLLNVFTSGDGLWYWYAVLFQRGQHLYSDLHLNQQPLFILLTDYSLHLFGSSWIGFRVFPAIQIVLYSVGLMLVARFAPWKDRDRAILVLAAFGMTMTIGYYRFDDYHVTTQILQVYSIWLLLLLARNATPRRALYFAAPLGVLAGLSLGNRLNDGAALFGASAIAIFGISRHQRLRHTLLLVLVALATFGVIVLATGDDVRTWFFYTFVLAAKIKGSSGHLWLYPLALPFRYSLGFFRNPHSLSPALYSLGIVVSALVLPRLQRGITGGKRLLLMALTSLVLIAATYEYVKTLYFGTLIQTIANLGVPVTYALLVVLAVRVLRRPKTKDEWRGTELVLLVPALQLVLAAVTAGHGPVETTPALALTWLLLPISMPFAVTGIARQGLILLTALLALSVFPYKYLFPFEFHTFVADTFFLNRKWIDHPAYGKMYVDQRHFKLISSMCEAIHQDPGEGLLSIPYPHANYFCGIAPWHGYVQTWYDTTSKQTIDHLVEELEDHPPAWIFYQRSVTSLQAHEIVYSGGQAIPHRKLDRFILDRIGSASWSIAQQHCFDSADWLLIRTTPPPNGKTPDSPILMNNEFNLCSYTEVLH